VFQGETAPILVAWMPAGTTDGGITFTGDVEVQDAATGSSSALKAGQALKLIDSPIFVVGLPADLVKEARANAGKSFPWGGDFSSAKTVSCELGNPEGNKGIFQTHRDATPTVKFSDGSTGVLVQGDIGHPISFYVHPTFASFRTQEYHIRAHVRRVSKGNVGMNLIYEVADSQGHAAYKNRGQWFGTSEDMGWQTYTWHVTDACFSKMWGFDFNIRPEQSVPFVIGKVEVSTVPFN
jgi:hypothetical protein